MKQSIENRSKNNNNNNNNKGKLRKGAASVTLQTVNPIQHLKHMKQMRTQQQQQNVVWRTEENEIGHIFEALRSKNTCNSFVSRWTIHLSLVLCYFYGELYLFRWTQFSPRNEHGKR